MKKYVILFKDNEKFADQRLRYMPEHLRFLERNADRITAAGPLFNSSDASGGLWLVEADTPKAVRALIHKDPFWPTGLRASVQILEWKQVFSDGKIVETQ